MSEQPFVGELDFSEYHPLDHRPLARRCREHYPYGVRSGWYHVWLDWNYRRGPAVRANTLCRLGRHSYSKFNREQCWACGAGE